MTLRPFHLAFPVHSLDSARAFWGGVMGCPEGRSAEEWVDFDFYGHQIVAHLAPGAVAAAAQGTNAVDGHDVPVPHFGIVLTLEDWHVLAERLTAAGTSSRSNLTCASQASRASKRRCSSAIRAEMRSR